MAIKTLMIGAMWSNSSIPLIGSGGKS